MNDEDEAYEIGKRDGYESAVQDFDLATGGDGEFKGSTIPGETVNVPSMKARVIERFEVQRKQLEKIQRLPPIPIHWARPLGSTFDEMRDNVWKCGLADKGDTILVWVNEGDFLHAKMVCGAQEHKVTLSDEDRT